MNTYKTISAPSESEFKDRGSRFLGFCIPINSLEDIKSKLKILKEIHPKAVHHCYAYRLGFDQTQYRANDNGEPSGSAGKPILGQIDSFEITNVLIVVVRYFGGSLLGVPGLINAYKTAAHDALQATSILEKNIEIQYMFEYDYTVMNDVMRIVKQYECTIISQHMMLFCNLTLGIAQAKEKEVIEKITELRSVEIKKV